MQTIVKWFASYFSHFRDVSDDDDDELNTKVLLINAIGLFYSTELVQSE